MKRYESPVQVNTSIHAGGILMWTKHVSTLTFESSGRVTFVQTDVNGDERDPPMAELVGEVTDIDDSKRIQFEFPLPVGDHRVRYYAAEVGSDLVCNVYSTINDSSRGQLFSAVGSNASDSLLSIVRLPEPPAVETATPVAGTRRTKVLATLQPKGLVDATAFDRNMKSLNRQLEFHLGAKGRLVAADLSGEQHDFLAALFSGPLDRLKDRARGQIKDYYADEIAAGDRRVRLHVGSLTMPEQPGGAWEITINVDEFGGVLVAFDLLGWDLVGDVLVG